MPSWKAINSTFSFIMHSLRFFTLYLKLGRSYHKKILKDIPVNIPPKIHFRDQWRVGHPSWLLHLWICWSCFQPKLVFHFKNKCVYEAQLVLVLHEFLLNWGLGSNSQFTFRIMVALLSACSRCKLLSFKVCTLNLEK